jgi:hypothetical protein
MLEILIENNIISQAKERSEKIGQLNNSVFDGARNVNGSIGELVVNEILGGSLDLTFDYDILHNEVKYDVKTNTINKPPSMYYVCDIFASAYSQQTDFYVFVFLLSDFKKCWIAGKISKNDMFSKGELREKGSILPSGVIARTSSYSIPIYKLEAL